jgi:ubiquinone biosynthesis protein Coq4
MTDAKPIFIVRLPYDEYERGLEYIAPAFEKTVNDYHVIVLEDRSVKEIQFQAFYAKDLIETDFEAFKAHVMGITSLEKKPKGKPHPCPCPEKPPHW